MSAQGTWGALMPWLGNLLTEKPINIRCNLAMLASDLAVADPDARAAMATMLARACDDVVRNNTADDAVLLDVLLRQRSAMDPASAAALNEDVMEQLLRLCRDWDPELAVDRLLRSDRKVEFLPPGIVAAAALGAARYLSRSDNTGPDRDIARERLTRIADVDQATPETGRGRLRAELSQQLRAMPRRERRLTIFALLQNAPSLLQASAEQAGAATAQEQDGAARAGRPKLRWLMFYAFAGALAISVGLTLLIGIAVAMASEEPSWFDSNLAWGAWARLMLVALLAGSLTSLLYTPSVGRKKLWWPAARRSLPPALGGAVGGILAIVYLTSSTLNDPESDNGLGVVFHNAGTELAQIGFALASVIWAAGWLAPTAVTFIRARLPDSGPLLSCICAGGAVLATVTIGCGLPLLLGWTNPSMMWAPLTVACTAASVAITAIEAETAPGTSPLAHAGRRASLQVIMFGVVVGYAVLLAPTIVGIAKHRMPSAGHIFLVPGSSEKDVEPGRVIKLAKQGDAPARVNVISAPGHKILQVGSGERTEFRIEPTATMCVDDCDPKSWQPMGSWLPMLLLPSAVHLGFKLQGTPVVPGSDRSISLPTAGPVTAKLESGVMYMLEVPTTSPSRYVDLALSSATGEFGSPAKLAVFNAERVPIPSNASTTLGRGKYLVCVYFGESDAPGCNPSLSSRMTLESGTVALTLNVRSGQPPMLEGTPLEDTMNQSASLIREVTPGTALALILAQPATLDLSLDNPAREPPLLLSVLEKAGTPVGDAEGWKPPDLSQLGASFKSPTLRRELAAGTYFVCVRLSYEVCKIPGKNHEPTPGSPPQPVRLVVKVSPP